MGLLRFNLFGAQFQIRPGFWVVILALSLSTQRSMALRFALAATMVFTIIAHELGHALMAKWHGLKPVVLVHAFGGVTTFVPPVVLTRAIAIRVMLAGPATGLLAALTGLVALKFGPALMGHPWPVPIRSSLVEFAEINGFWSIVNLLPIMPFDGGQVLVHLLGPSRRSLAAQISFVFGCLAALVLYRAGLSVAAAVFAIASVVQFLASRRALAVAPEAASSRQVEALLTQARRALDESDHEGATRLGRMVVDIAPTAVLRRQGAEVCAWAALGVQDLAEARRALEWMSDGPIEPLLQAALLEADGDAERAVHCLRQARAAGDDRPQLAASLIRLLIAVGRYGEAALTTIQILEHVSLDEARQVVTACREGGRPIPAAELAEALFATTGEAPDLVATVACYVAAGNRESARSTLALALGRGLSLSALLDCPEWARLEGEADLAGIVERSRPANESPSE